MSALSVQVFVLALVCGSAALALWVLARFTNFGPRTFFWAIAHVLLAMVLLRLVSFPLHAINAMGLPAAGFIGAFGVALPLFVYAFLSGGWVTRLAIGLLRP
jgi:hypothetical protein